MSDSVVKLRIDSEEYDANIKRAGQALTDYFNKVKEGGGTLMHLDEGVMEAVQAMGELGTMAANSKGALRELTQATTDMTIAYRSLTDEEKSSPLGQAMQQSIQQMTDRAGMMRDAMDDVNLSIKNVASDTATFDQLAGAANVATSGFQVLQGATKVLGIEMGDNVEVIAKLQAAMAVTNGLSQIQAALQKESAFMQGLNAVKTAATAVAQQAYAVATGEATVAQIAFNVAANANPYGLILGAIGLVVGAIGAFVSIMGDSTKEVETGKTAMDDLAASVDAAAESYAHLKENIKSLGIGGQKEYKMLKENLTSQNNELYRRDFEIVDQMHSYERAGTTDDPRYEALKKQHEKIAEEGKKVQKELANIEKANSERVARITKYASLDFSDITSEAEASSALNFIKEQMKFMDNTSSTYASMKRAKEYAESYVLPQFQDPSDRKTSTKITSGKSSKQDITYAEDSIMAQEKLVQELTLQWKTASAELKDGYLEQLNEAKEKLTEMTEVSDPDKLIEAQFPDMSKQNFDTGYSNSAQAKYDSARQDFALSGISNNDISNYLTSIKGAIDQSDLGSDLYNKLTENLKDADAMQSVLTQAMASGAKAADLAPIAEELKAKLLEGEIDESTWEEFIDKINALITDSDLKIHFDFDTSEVETGLQKTEKDTKAIATAAQNVSSVVGTIGQAFNSIEDPAAKVMGTVMQAIATVASGYATATEQAAALGPWAWIAFAATGLATMISTISAIHQQTGYANGGIIPGNSYSGDNMVGMLPNGATVGLDAGELILNRSQQSSIASQLEGGPGFGNMQLETRIDAEELIIMLNNNGLRRGLGRFING